MSGINKVNGNSVGSRYYDHFDFERFNDEFREYYEREQKAMGKFNILIMGKTGVGKSTLINSVFGEDIAETGIGEPVTQNLQRYEKHDLPMVLYDTKGFELKEETQHQILNEIHELINQYKRTGNEEDYIHFVWYCINTQGRRIEEYEKNIIKKLSTEYSIPVVLVLTQNYGEASSEFRKIIPTDAYGANHVVEVVAKQIIIDEVENIIIKEKGLKDLIDLTYEILPESKKTAFVKAQKVNIKLKKERARNEVNLFILANAGVGFVPIPFADAPIMVGLELAMISRIAVIFSSNFEDLTKSVIPALVGVGGVAGAAVTGKTIVTNILKLIPGFGWVVGGAISAAAAAFITGALGYAFIEVMCTIEENKNKTGRRYTDAEFIKMLTDAFIDALKNKKTTQESS